MTREEISDRVEQGMSLLLMAMLASDCPSLPSDWTLLLARKMAATARAVVPPAIAVEHLMELVGETHVRDGAIEYEVLVRESDLSP